jgi:hypothetical protein
MSNGSRQQSGHPTTFDTTEAETDAVRTLAEGTADAAEASRRLSVDTLFDLLSHPGRRYVLTYLLQSEGYATCSELVDHVVAVSDHTMTDRQFRKRLTSELTHTHLPKLEDRGLIEYNTERQIVSPTAATPTVRPYLRLALTQQRLRDRGDGPRA